MDIQSSTSKSQAIKRFVAFSVTGFFSLVSVYVLWGWVTLIDIRHYCDSKNLDYAEVTAGLVSRLDVQRIPGAADQLPTIKTNILRDSREPIQSWIVPFTFHSEVRQGESSMNDYTFTGGILEPFLGMSENTANALFSLAFGYLTSVLILIIEGFGTKPISTTRVYLRPVAGSLTALLSYLLLLSGGSIIWKKVSGVSDLSLGLISIISAFFCESLIHQVKALRPNLIRR